MLKSGDGYVNVTADATNTVALFSSRSIRQILAHFFGVFISKGLYQSSENEKDSRCLAFTSSAKREIRHFQVVVVQRRQRHRQKSVMHVQSCCFVYLNDFLV